MKPDLVVVHSSVGGGHKAAALAIAEAARARGLEVVVLDTFEHAPRVLGRAYLGVHLTAQGGIPALYGAAYFNRNHRDGAFEPIRRGIDHVAWAAWSRGSSSCSRGRSSRRTTCLWWCSAARAGRGASSVPSWAS